MTLKAFSIILAFMGLLRSESSSNLPDIIRENIAKINICFYSNKYPDKTLITELEKNLNNLKSNKLLTDSISTDYEFIKSDQLNERFAAFKMLYQDTPKIDTLTKVFQSVNQKFNQVFGNYFVRQMDKSSRSKLLLFSTSMSCECTLEMCHKQEIEIQKLELESNEFEYAVVDCYYNSEIQTKYNIGFIPTLIIMDSEGKELKRFVREDSLYSAIAGFLNDIKK